MKKIYVVLGFFFLTLGGVGVFLPVLPTVPFLLLASYFLAKGSKRFHQWFTQTNLYERHLRPFEESRALPLSTKWRILLLSSAMLAIPFFTIEDAYLRLGIGLLVAIKYYVILFRIRTVNQNCNSKFTAWQKID